MTEMVMGLIIGFAVGCAVLSVLLYVAIMRVRAAHVDRLAAQDESIADLRRELATDKETNRHLRHQIHSMTDRTDGGLIGPFESSNSTIGLHGVDNDANMSEQNNLRHQLAETQRSLESVRARLADREAKLREYREAVKEIRLSLESQDQLRDIISITSDLPANAQAESS